MQNALYQWLRLNMTEKLFTGTLNHNQNKQKQKVVNDLILSVQFRIVFMLS